MTVSADGGFHQRQPRHSKEEFARRGNEIYQSQVRQQIEEGNDGKIVAIDIETGAFEVADTTIEATDRLFELVPNAQPWVIRIGHRTVYRFGSRSLKQP
jgi:peptide subunit release factor RF-3